MRIGMMADNYTTHLSGVTNFISLTKRFLEYEGHEVYVFTFDKVGEVADEPNVINNPGIPIADFYLNFSYNQPTQRLLKSMDIVHVQHPFISGILARRYCKPHNIPIVFTNHTRYDLYSRAYFPILPQSISEGSLKAYLSQFYRACDLVIIPSNSLYQVLIDNFGLDAPVAVIPNGVDLEPFCTDNEPVDRQSIYCSKDDVVAIYIGRLAPEKNLSFLLRAFQKVAIPNPRVRLLLVGDGPERKNLEAQVQRMGIGSKVFFTGKIPYSKVPHYLTAADMFITPSGSEVFPLSIIEAIGSGLPVLGINAPGTRDIIEDGITGLIAPDDVDLFAEKFSLLATNSELRHELGKQALQASKKFDIRLTTKFLLEQYHLLIEAAKKKKIDARLKPPRFLDRFQ